MKDRETPMERIVRLSSEALAQKDGDKFIDCLLVRAPFIDMIGSSSVEAQEDILRAWLELESEISNRLAAERIRILERMECLSLRRKAIRSYAPRFPFPPMPAFFDRPG